MKKILYFTGVILFIFFIWYAYAFLFLRINEEIAKNNALAIIASRYSMYCGGGFEKYLQLEIAGYNEKYEFTANNGRCTIVIYMDEYGAYDLVQGPN